jgi:mRNA-degrading endonuclease RelE of RelBE toxin-antitoxin system
MEFIEAPAFTRHIHEYLDDESYGVLQERLATNPRAGDVMPGTGGFRKMRWADPRRGKGRIGGLRIIYFYFESEQQIWLITLYGKNEAADLTQSEKKALKAALDAELKARAEKRSAHQRPRRLA